MAKRRAEVEVTLRDRASAGLKRLGGAVSGLLKPIALVTTAAAGLATFFGGRFLLGAIRSAGEFDEAMSRVGAVTGATTEEMGRLRAAADEAGATTRFTATEAANGLEELARGGQNATESIQTLVPVLDLAAANNQSVAESALQVVTALNAFGLGAEHASRVSDVYTRAAQRSAQTTQQLAEAMEYAAPLARSVGLDIETTAALIGRLADQGFRGSRGGTALANTLTDLSNPASSFRRELAKLDITSTDFIEVLEELERRGPEAEAALNALGKRSGPAIRSLVASGIPALRELDEGLRDVTGASAEAAEQMADNLPGALTIFKSAFDATRRALVEPITERLVSDLQRLSEILTEFRDSETLVQIRTVLADAFETGRKAVVEFIKGVDFAEVQSKIEAFATSTGKWFADIREHATALGRTFQVVVGSVQVFIGALRAGFNVVATVITGVATASIFFLEKIVAALDNFSLRSVSALSKAREELAHFRGFASELTGEFARDMVDATDQVAGGWDRLVASFEDGAPKIQKSLEVDKDIERVGNRAEQAADDAEKLRAAMDRVADINDRLIKTLSGTSGEIDKTRKSAFNATGTFGQIGDEINRFDVEAGKSRLTLADLRREAEAAKTPFDKLSEAIKAAGSESELEGIVGQLEDLAEAGKLNEEQLKLLKKALIEASDALKNLGEEEEDGEEKAEGLAKRVSELTEKTNEWTQELGEAEERVGGFAAAMVSLMQPVKSLSEGASEAVDGLVRSLNGIQLPSAYLKALNNGLREIRAEFDQQTEQADEWIDALAAGSQEALKMAENAVAAGEQVRLLDQASMDRLTAAIRTAREEMQRLRDETAQGVADLEDELLRLQGRTDELEQRRVNRQREEIRNKLEIENLDTQSRANLNQQLQLLDEIERTKRRQREETERTAEAERETADEIERQERSRQRSGLNGSGGINKSEIEIKVTGDRERGLGLSEAEINRIVGRVLASIERDRTRTL